MKPNTDDQVGKLLKILSHSWKITTEDDLDPIKVTTVMSFGIDTDTSRLKNQKRFFTQLSFDLEPDITSKS